MAIYFINLFLIILLSFIIKNKKKYVIIISILLFLILALRDSSLGVDLDNYKMGYDYINKLSFFDMISKLNFFSVANLVYPFSYESGYVVANWITSNIGLNFHGFLVLCALFNIGTFGYFIYKYSDIPWMSFIIMCTFGIFSYFFGILRHSISLCLFLWSIHFFLKDKKIKSILFFVFSFLFQRSVIILAPLFLFKRLKTLDKKKLFISIILCIPFFLLSSTLYSKFIYKLMDFFGKGYVGHGFQINNLIILLFLISFIVIIFANFKNIDNKFIIISIVALIISLYVEIIGLYNDNFARTVQMYNSFLIFTIPYVFKQYEKQKIVVIFKFLIVIMLSLFYYSTLKDNVIVPYKIEENNIIFQER